MEIQILDWIQGLHTQVLDKVMCFITSLGNAGIIWICLAVVLLLIPRTRKSGIIVMSALVLDVILCNGILKHVFARVRPCDVNTAASFAAVSALFFAGEKKLCAEHASKLIMHRRTVQ